MLRAELSAAAVLLWILLHVVLQTVVSLVCFCDLAADVCWVDCGTIVIELTQYQPCPLCQMY